MEQQLIVLRKQYKTYRLAVLGLIGLLVIAAVLAIFSSPLATLCMLGIAVIYHFALLRRLQKDYTQSMARQNVLGTLGARLGTKDLDEQAGGVLTEREISAAQLLPYNKEEKGGCMLRQGLSGSWKGMEVALCDATLMQDFQLVTNGKRRVHFTSGVWMQFTLPEQTEMDWRVLDENALPTPIRRNYYESLFDLEEKECAVSEMHLYAPVVEGRIPGNRVMKRIRDLAEYTTGKAAISLRGNLLTVFLTNRFVAMPISVKTPPTAAMLSLDPLPELEYVWRLANEICRKD